jgi:hypothetical protein
MALMREYSAQRSCLSRTLDFVHLGSLASCGLSGVPDVCWYATQDKCTPGATRPRVDSTMAWFERRSKRQDLVLMEAASF